MRTGQKEKTKTKTKEDSEEKHNSMEAFPKNSGGEQA